MACFVEDAAQTDLGKVWWAEAGKYQVLPLDDRFYVRALGREGLYAERDLFTFYEGAVRIQPFSAPQTLNRSWAASAEIQISDGGAHGPIAVTGSDSSGRLVIGSGRAVRA